jgi:hypothetical protein
VLWCTKMESHVDDRDWKTLIDDEQEGECEMFEKRSNVGNCGRDQRLLLPIRLRRSILGGCEAR